MCERFSGYVSPDGKTIYPGNLYSHSACEIMHELTETLHGPRAPLPFEITEDTDGFVVRALTEAQQWDLEARLTSRFPNQAAYQEWAYQNVPSWVVKCDKLIQSISSLRDWEMAPFVAEWRTTLPKIYPIDRPSHQAAEQAFDAIIDPSEILAHCYNEYQVEIRMALDRIQMHPDTKLGLEFDVCLYLRSLICSEQSGYPDALLYAAKVWDVWARGWKLVHVDVSRGLGDPILYVEQW